MQVRESLLTAAMCFLLLSTSLSVYTCLNRHAAAHVLLGLFAAIAATATMIYFHINRNQILSRTTETEPGKLDLDFYGKVFGTVSVPLVGLLLSFFPELSGSVLGLFNT